MTSFSRKSALGIFAVAAATMLAILAPCASAQPGKLIVQITFDQLRADLLVRYRSALTHGFRRIESGGWWFQNGEVEHALTVSFPGHATLATGVNPSRHGLTANEWWEETPRGWGEVDVSHDDRYPIVGHPDRPGVSPQNLLVSTLGDWVKAADPRSLSIALSGGDTIAVAYAGRHADAAYWFDSSAGGFVTSTYYGNQIAPWVAALNQSLYRQRPSEWRLTVPARYRGLAHPDASPYESGRSQCFSPPLHRRGWRRPNQAARLCCAVGGANTLEPLVRQHAHER